MENNVKAENFEEMMEESKPKVSDVCIRALGLGSSLCAGVVVKQALNMITPPPMKPATMLAFEAGKFVISTLVTTGIEVKVIDHLTETKDAFVEAVGKIRKSNEKLEGEQKALSEAKEEEA